MGHCENCRWWGVDYEGVCDLPDTVDKHKYSIVFDIMATALDDSGLEAQLITGPDFGCVLFAEKRKEIQGSN